MIPKFRVWNKRFKHWESGLLLLDSGELVVREYGEVIPVEMGEVEVMVSLGLKDKNGVEIYEGDILRDDCDELSEVKFGELPLDKSGDCVCTYSAFYCKCYGKLGQAPSYECQEIGDWHEVIGNRFEHPELLGKKDEWNVIHRESEDQRQRHHLRHPAKRPVSE